MVREIEAVNSEKFHELDVGGVGAEGVEDLGQEGRAVDCVDCGGAAGVSAGYVDVLPLW